MLTLLVILTIAAHLACVQVAAAGPLLTAWLTWRHPYHSDAPEAILGRWLAKVTLVLLGVGILLGLLGGWLLMEFQHRHYLLAFERLDHKVWWGLAELAFYVFCITAFLAWGYFRSPRTTSGRACHVTLPLLAGTNLMYHFPPLFIVIAKIAASELQAPDAIDAAHFRAIVFRNDVLSKILHFWGASFVVTGIALMAYGLVARPAQPDLSTQAARWGARLALVAAIAQLPLGLWVLVELPWAAQESVLGGNWIASSLLIGAILAAVVLLHHLASIAAGDVTTKTVVRSIALMALLMVLMVGTMQRLNHRFPVSDGGGANRAIQSRSTRPPVAPVTRFGHAAAPDTRQIPSLNHTYPRIVPDDRCIRALA